MFFSLFLPPSLLFLTLPISLLDDGGVGRPANKLPPADISFFFLQAHYPPPNPESLPSPLQLITSHLIFSLRKHFFGVVDHSMIADWKPLFFCYVTQFSSAPDTDPACVCNHKTSGNTWNTYPDVLTRRLSLIAIKYRGTSGLHPTCYFKQDLPLF